MSTPRALSRGTHRVPGDKSITHRALMLAALAIGKSRIIRPLTSLDARSTAAALRATGADITPLRHGATVEVEGRGFHRTAGVSLDCGNSGTTVRLLLGLLAGRPGPIRFTGDRSLRRRPMKRVTEPLGLMGARFEGDPDHLPLVMHGGPLRPIDWRSPVASAQVKSALLLAGVSGGVPVSVSEPVRSRDHTERMLASFGYTLDIRGTTVRMEPTGTVTPFEISIPGDPSSAAFLVGAALLGGQGEVTIVEVGLNPTRTGFLSVLERMGADISLGNERTMAGEPTGDITVKPSRLRATTIAPGEVASLVDEVPILACLAARADGESRFDGLAELRHKESDRLALLAQNLRAIGVEAAAEGDSLSIVGTDRPLAGQVRTEGDHRVAMAFGVLAKSGGIVVDDPDCAAVSFPGFGAALAAIEEECG